MLSSFKIRNFRCFRELTLTDIARVNLIVGMNNIGKTALLEALFLHCGAYNPELAIRVNALRGIEVVKVELGRWTETPWDSLFHQFDTTVSIELEGENAVTGKRLLSLKVLREPSDLARVPIQYRHNEMPQAFIPDSLKKPLVLELECKEGEQSERYRLIFDQLGIRMEPLPPAPPFPAFFQASRTRIPFVEEAERFGRLEIQGNQDVILEVLKLIEPGLKRLATVVVAQQPMLHGDVGVGRLIPLPVMGEGMVRLASLVLHIGNAPHGVVLIDEIENGLHYSVLPKVWQAIGEVAQRFDTQIFATTHSLECVEAAHTAFSQSGRYDFRLYRLERIDDTIQVIPYDQETMEAAIEAGLEVR